MVDALEASRRKEAATAEKLCVCEWQLQQQVAALREESLSLRKQAIELTKKLRDGAENQEEVSIPVLSCWLSLLSPSRLCTNRSCVVLLCAGGGRDMFTVTSE